MQFLTGTSQTSVGGGGMFGGTDGAELYAATASAPDHYFCQRMLYAMQFDSVAAAGAGMCSPLLPSSLSSSSPPPSSSLSSSPSSSTSSPPSSSPLSSSSSSSSSLSFSSPLSLALPPSAGGRFYTTTAAVAAAAGDVKMMDACPALPANDHHLHHLHHHHHNHQQQQQQHAVENRKRPLQDTLDGANVKRTHNSSVTGRTTLIYY